MMTVQEFISEYGLRMSYVSLGDEMVSADRAYGVNTRSRVRNYWVTITGEDDTAMSFKYSMGGGINGGPVIGDVVGCLLLDASAVRDSAGADDLEGFANFCQEFGYENIQEAAETYRSCINQTADLMELTGLNQEELAEIDTSDF